MQKDVALAIAVEVADSGDVVCQAGIADDVGRIRAVLSPRVAASGPTAAPAAQPPVQLRQSVTIGGEKK